VHPDNRDSLILQAAIEFGPDCTYTVKHSTLGPTLHIHAETHSNARLMRKKVPGTWNGLYTVVLYNRDSEDGLPEITKEASLYDPNLT